MILSGKSAPEVTATLFALAIRSSLILNTMGRANLNYSRFARNNA
jgi:hypothetical protein